MPMAIGIDPSWRAWDGERYQGHREGSGGNQGRAMRGLRCWPASETPHGEHGMASGNDNTLSCLHASH